MTNLTLWTEEEAARRLLLHPRTLRKLRQSGAIQYVALVGRRIAYRPEDCEAYVESRVLTADRVQPPRPSRRGKVTTNVVSFSARRRERQLAKKHGHV